MLCARAHKFEKIFRNLVDQVANALASAFSIEAAFQCSSLREPEAEAEDE